MNEQALELWARALKSLQSAKILLPTDFNSSASRAYYAAFYAVSALYAIDDKAFSKHSALETGVHRDLVKTGLWPKELGKDYSSLLEIRATGDYGGAEQVSENTAKEAIKAAERILNAVREAHPDIFKSG